MVSPDRWLGSNFNGYGRELFSIAVLLTFITYEKFKYPFKAGLTELGIKSLGIYLVNAPAMHIISTLIYHFLPALLGQALLYQAILFLVGLTVPLLLMSLTFKLPIIKPGYRFIFG
jgi:surface polysaccharide O-acyltransferase-like enzyme